MPKLDLTIKPSDSLLNDEWLKPVLDNACTCFCDIKKQSEKLIKKIGSDAKKRNFLLDDPDFNNIIVFTGERGAGKTTAMRTFI